MAQVKLTMGLVLVTITLLYAGATAQSSCTNALVSMLPCLDYVRGNSSTPTTGCCTKLDNVAKSQPECLCLIIGGEGSSLGINQTLALALPAACNVQTPPVSQCKSMSSKPNIIDFDMFNLYLNFRYRFTTSHWNFDKNYSLKLQQNYYVVWFCQNWLILNRLVQQNFGWIEVILPSKLILIWS